MVKKKNKRGPSPGIEYQNVKRTKLGANIASIRRIRNISQEKLSEKTGISSRMISYYERESENIPASKLKKIAIALNVPTDRLLRGNIDNSGLETRRALLKRIEMLKKLPKNKQKIIMDMIDNLSN